MELRYLYRKPPTIFSSVSYRKTRHPITFVANYPISFSFLIHSSVAYSQKCPKFYKLKEKQFNYIPCLY